MKALKAIKLIKKFFNQQELVTLVTSNFFYARVSRVHLPPSELNNGYIIFPTPAQQQARRKSLGHQNSSNFEKPVQEKRKSVNFDNRQQTSL